MERILRAAGVLSFFITLVLLSCGHVFAEAYNLYYVSTNRVSYTGSVSRYATLPDAEAGQNVLGSYSITNRPGGAPYTTPYRDAVLMMWSNGSYDGYPPSQPYAYNMNDFYTNVYSSTVQNQGGEGTGNPNKTPEGLIQLTGGRLRSGQYGQSRVLPRLRRHQLHAIHPPGYGWGVELGQQQTVERTGFIRVRSKRGPE